MDHLLGFALTSSEPSDDESAGGGGSPVSLVPLNSFHHPGDAPRSLLCSASLVGPFPASGTESLLALGLEVMAGVLLPRCFDVRVRSYCGSRRLLGVTG